MSLDIDFRVVGIYAYYPNLNLPDLDENSTIQQITQAVQDTKTGFSFVAGPLDDGEPKALSFSYDLTQLPPGGIPNAKNPKFGDRTIAQALSSDPASVWQFYRAAVMSDGETEITVRNPTFGQPSFGKTTISEGLKIPSGFHVVRYRLIWRLLIIDMDPEDAEMFRNAARAMVG